jgi:hypothetical protein
VSLRRGASRLVRIGLVGILLSGTLLTNASRPAPASAGSEAVPDLAMAPLGDFRIQWINGRRMLRFTAMMVNVGSGHFELRGSRSSSSERMVMRQYIFESSSRSASIARRIRTDAVAKYSGDGHNHWHVQEMMRYDLWGGAERLRGAKVGFCFLDSDLYNPGLPGYSGGFYTGSMCSTNPNVLSNRMGISIGMGDEYEWFLAWQWVDITGLPSGTYTLRAKVDPYGFFEEEKEGNQCAYARLQITSGGVSLRSRGPGCVNDWSGSRFAADIAWMYANGLTTGCAPDLFCPKDPVTRAQMATFLRRAFDLGPASQDYFDDDNGNTHEGSINRLREAGITTGCTTTRFCPNRVVTRGQMATFLARALGLPAPSDDYFHDDNSSPHEDNINRIFEAGITTGCGGSSFCPNLDVRRETMAAFLHRALGG